MWWRLRGYLLTDPGDPIPRVVTVLGLAMSACGWVYGWLAGFDVFLLNVAAAVGLVGPALFFSNIIVKKLQDARARNSVEPLLWAVNELLCEVFEAADPVYGVFGWEGPQPSRQPLLDRPDFSRLAGSLRHSYAVLTAAAESLEATGAVGPYTIVRGMHPLKVPQLSSVSKLVQQADRYYQMPWSATGAVTADDWGQTCGFDFIDQIPPHDGLYYAPTRATKVGLAEIRQYSKTQPIVVGAHLQSYFNFIRGCVHFAHDIANKLANEAPPLLFVDPTDRPWAIRRRNLSWTSKRVLWGAKAGPRPW